MNKDKLISLINLWLDVVSSAAQDAGWHGDSPIARFMEYGIVPRGSEGRDQSNVTSMIAIRQLRDPHPDFYEIDRVMRSVMRLNDPKNHDDPLVCDPRIAAVLARHYYCGACPKTSDGDTPDKLRPYTNADRAAAIGQTLRTFERNLAQGYDILMQVYERPVNAMMAAKV